MATAPQYGTTPQPWWRVPARDWPPPCPPPPAPTAPSRSPGCCTPRSGWSSFESVVEAAFVVGRDDWGAIGKALILLAFVAKVVFAHLARRLSAGGAMGLLVFEWMGILVALGADWSMALRIALVATVVAVHVLVLSSLHAFPTPELPRPMTSPTPAPQGLAYPTRTKVIVVVVLAIVVAAIVLAYLPPSSPRAPARRSAGPMASRAPSSGTRAASRP